MKSPQIHLAIADDHELMRNGLRFILAPLKNVVIDFEAFDGLDLIEKLSRVEEKPDICILDINMPRLNGYEALYTISKRWPSIKVIILTVSYTEYTIVKTLSEGACCCLPKEVLSKELEDAMFCVYNNGVYHRGLDARVLTKALIDKNKRIKLSQNEISYLKYACSDQTHKQIASIMGVSDRTVDSYRDTLCNKLQLKNRIELVIFAIESGIRGLRTIAQ